MDGKITMIKKLFSLIWTLFTDRYVRYNWTNLWWYLTKGYTWADVQDGDKYILKQVYDLLLENEEFDNKVNERTTEEIINSEPNPLFSAILLYLSDEYDFFEPEWQIKIQKTIKEELGKQIFHLWR